MKNKWQNIWKANSEVFIVSEWDECPEDNRKAWHLPAQFNYFSSGDMNLRVGIIASDDCSREEEFLLGGIQWGNKLGNGARTVIYFVAPDFSPVFLRAIAELGRNITAKAVYWREKLNPSLYLVSNRDYHSAFQYDLGDAKPGWDEWARKFNPVARNHLSIIRSYFDGLAKRRVRAVFKKNSISYCWGNIEIAEIKRKGNKLELNTKVKWTRNKSVYAKFLKTGWVDFSGNINEEFCWAINGILEFLDNMEANGTLDDKDNLGLKLIYDKDFVPACWGEYFDFPWIKKERGEKLLDINQLYFFQKEQDINVVMPLLEKATMRIVNCLLSFAALSLSGPIKKEIRKEQQIFWNKKIIILAHPSLQEELRLCYSWLKTPENFPLFMLPEDWKTEGLKGFDSELCTDLSGYYY